MKELNRLVDEEALGRAWKELLKGLGLPDDELVKEAEAERRRILAAAHEAAERERARRTGEAKRRATEMVLSALAGLLDQMGARALDMVKERMEDPAHRERIIRRLLAEALSQCRGRVVVRVQPGDRAVAEAFLAETEREGEVVQDPEMEAGVVVEEPERGYRVDNTLGSRFRRALSVGLVELRKLLGS